MSSLPTSKAQFNAYQLWELQAFDSPVRGPQAELQQTAVQLEHLQQQAQQEGYAAGYRDGSGKAAAEAVRLRQILDSLADESQRCEQRLADDLLALALAISKQVMRQALKFHPETILTVINEVLRQAPQLQQRAHLVLHPEDVALVRASLGEHLTRSGWEIVEDAELQRGGCRLHTHDCDIDATLERRWQRVVVALGDKHAWSE